MKSLSLIISSVVLLLAGYFFATDFQYSTESNYLIYMSMLVILMSICILGIIINLPMLRVGRKKVRTLIYNSYSNKRIKNKSFDSRFEIL
ncbi:MAG TPA: hypothetical protein VF676_06755 [Flavobacterium sp.]|jgi:membrane protein DedA with SNARE-associated domain